MMVLLVTNYREDRQQSMLRFGRSLADGLSTRGLTVFETSPRSVFGKVPVRNSTLRKWSGYIDKFVLYPMSLRRAVRKLRNRGEGYGGPSIGHIVDHSNAMYTKWLRDVPHVVTCNDLLAVRAARGEFACNRTQWSGRQLQKWILHSLNRAQRVACISEATRRDLRRLSALRERQTSVIYMGLTHPYAPMNKRDASEVVAKLLASCADGRRVEKEATYLLHVGGGQWYKNRVNVARLSWECRRRMPAERRRPLLIYVGPKPEGELRSVIQSSPEFEEDVFFLSEVSNEELRALYSAAEALLFPSLEEGFGWPVIEAQACGCPVVTTNKAPMTEVGGTGPVYLEEEEISGGNPEALLRGGERIAEILCESDDGRERRVVVGYENVKRFSIDTMLRQYMALYEVAVEERNGRPS